MRGTAVTWGFIALIAAVVFIVVVPDWTFPTGDITQIGNSPTSMLQFNYGQVREPVSQAAPPPLPPASGDTRPATTAFRNVTVLTDIDASHFMRLQQAITQWVSPQQGCGFCHAGNDYASDANPHKAAARLMLQMTRHLNSTWASHVMPAGVTCYTCHRGQPVPAEIWFPSKPEPIRPFVAFQEPYREDADTVRKFFPDASYAEYFLEDTPISAQSVTALPSRTVASEDVVKRIYEMMMQMSDGIGVNCGYCHESRAFEDWSQSTPARWNAYYAIRLLRDLNRNFLIRLSAIIPQTRQMVGQTALPVLPQRALGPQTGNGLVLCATCHYGRPKPLGGAAMLAAYPGLAPAGATPPPAAAPAPPAASASPATQGAPAPPVPTTQPAPAPPSAPATPAAPTAPATPAAPAAPPT
jgi:photosynthetic reaction center cytochrome c subunit